MIDDLDEPQFCADYGYCICGNDCLGPIYRVIVDDDAVERGAKAMFAEEQCDRRQKLDVEANWRGRLDDRDRDEYRRLTRAVLTSLIRAES